ncbi:P-loop containing nucleoside triphosphate hydrolase protein [Mycena polygramma]|nr:P-loop containing nucleoside triphosphate hydrolase protein [Mycena polygramma]
MLPSEPKIFHGRNSELSEILQHFSQGSPRIAILGAGGMGKTTLARAVLHNAQIAARYGQHRYFVACDSATSKEELAALIGAHLGLMPGKDLTRAVFQYFTRNPPSLLILDNLETVWEQRRTRNVVEEFLSLLTDVGHLTLIVTMRGVERPSKIAWTHPFLPSLRPLEQDAARHIFIDIADDVHEPEEIDQVLALTDNMPLAISLLAHLVDSEGCSMTLSRWGKEKTSMLSDGFDRNSNLELSISLSLSSPRLESFPHSRELLSLLSILPDGLSDAELVQSKLPIDDILACKAALIGTGLAYNDSHRRLKVLLPIREYTQKIQPPDNNHIQSLRRYFQELLELDIDTFGTSSGSGTGARISSNLANIQNILRRGLHKDHPDLVDCIYCTCYLSRFSRLAGQGGIPLMSQILNVFPEPCDHRLEAYVIIEMLDSWYHFPVGNPETLVSQAVIHFEHCDDTDLKCKLH